jgi:hypothetical protein
MNFTRDTLGMYLISPYSFLPLLDCQTLAHLFYTAPPDQYRLTNLRIDYKEETDRRHIVMSEKISKFVALMHMSS